MKEWKEFNQDEVAKTHGQIYYYRDLYEGKHSKIFPRARHLIEKGEITDSIYYGENYAQNVQTPYITANVSKLIPEIPATLVSRSLGDISTSIESNEIESLDDEEQDDEELESIDYDVTQQQVIDDIQENTHLEFEHWGNIVQQQVDGGLVGVPWLDEKGLRLEFKARDVYFPHDDNMGIDLAYEIEIDEERYLQVYREEVIDGDLHTSHILYHIENTDKTKQLDEETTMKLLGIDELYKVYKGRDTSFIIYWPNEKTFMNPLGVSCLKGQDGKQDEINWTLTRNAITFERNGKPRIAVSKEIMQALEQKAVNRYGDSSRIDHRDLEVMTMDDDGNAMEIIQIDISRIGDIQWVKDLMKLMLMETKTSEKAIDFYLNDNAGGQAESGVAKFYDLFTSIIKSEQIQQEYIYFIKQLFKSALWLAKYVDDSIEIEEPDIDTKAMIPISKKELTEQNAEAFDADIQSLETTVRRNNPTASEEWIQEEMERIESEESTSDSFSLMRGRQNLEQMMGNRDENNEPINDDNNDDEEME